MKYIIDEVTMTELETVLREIVDSRNISYFDTVAIKDKVKKAFDSLRKNLKKLDENT